MIALSGIVTLAMHPLLWNLLPREPRFIPSIIQLSEAENNKRVQLENNSLAYKELVKFNDKLYLISHAPCVDFSFVTTQVDFLPDQFTTLTFYLDPNQVKGELKLMRGKLNESFIPMGMHSAKTVNAILKDKGIPAFQRLDWPVLYVEDQPIGIPGVSLNRAFAPNPSLPSYLKVTFVAC